MPYNKKKNKEMKVSNKKKSTISKVSNANPLSGSLVAGPFTNSTVAGSFTNSTISTTAGCGPLYLSVNGIGSNNISTNTYVSYGALPKVEITLLGKSFSVYQDSEILHIYSLIDFLGIVYYKSIKNMKLEQRLDEEIRDFLELELQIFERGQKIKKALNSDDKP